ncbi:hypothetical protein RB595_004142 [Gaeumannomyces hyphopodioides]
MFTSLCSRCERFDIQAFRQEPHLPRGFPLVDVIRSAQEDCTFCSLLLESILAIDPLPVRSRLYQPSTHRNQSTSDQVGWLHRWWLRWIWPPWIFLLAKKRRRDVAELHGQPGLDICEFQAYIHTVRWRDLTDRSQPRMAAIMVAADPGTPAYDSGDISGGFKPESHSWTSRHTKALGEWHQACSQEHHGCRCDSESRDHAVRDGPVPLPTRCIEILPGEDETRPKLVLRETEGLYGVYITLSHRWQQETHRFKTVGGNYQSKMRDCGGFKLFHDTAYVASTQGIRYIWIDSLCIIQDSTTDWERESQKMGDYYQRAWLTIAATGWPRATPGGRSDEEPETYSEGLFGQQPEAEAQKPPQLARLPYRDCNGDKMGSFYLQCADEQVLEKKYMDEVAHSPLMRRGWVYQERCLSQRMLTFTKGSVFAQCHAANPTLLIGDRARLLGVHSCDSGKSIRMKHPMRGSINSQFSTVGQLLGAWMGIVEAYSGLELTYMAKDRLMALEGIAGLHRDAMGDLLGRNEGIRGAQEPARSNGYICGLWHRWAEGLLWEQMPSTQARVARVEGFPTWSWASMQELLGGTDGDDETHPTSKGLAVRWSRSKSRQPQRHISLTRAIPIGVGPPVESDDTWRPLFDGVAPPLSVDADQIKHGRFFILGMLGRLVRVRVHDLFTDEEDLTATETLTARPTSILHRRVWRCVTTTDELDSVVGWASLEHPDYQQARAGAAGQNPTTLFALAVQSLAAVGGFGFGNYSGYQTVYCVLYLAQKTVPGYGPEDCFERVGTGRLFGNDVETLYKKANERDLWLV